MLSESHLKFAVTAIGTSLLVGVVAKLSWKVPNPLLLVSGVIFVVCFALFLNLRRRFDPPATAQQALLLICVWIVAAASFFGAVYRWDKAGWIWFKLTGYDVTLAEELSSLVDLRPREFVRQNPIFSLDPHDSTKLALSKGTYNIDKTIILPSGVTLAIAPGTMLRFKIGCSLISYSPVIARGTEQSPIIFTAQNKWRKWGVIGVVSKEKSIFEHVRFEHARQALVNGIDFVAGLNLHGAEVEITRCQFSNMFGKDAVNIRDGRVLIRFNIFRDCFKDGLDLDGGAGEVSDNRFINCDDEGIDLSENFAVQVFRNEILDARGGRIAADNDFETIKSLNTLGYSGK